MRSISHTWDVLYHDRARRKWGEDSAQYTTLYLKFDFFEVQKGRNVMYHTCICCASYSTLFCKTHSLCQSTVLYGTVLYFYDELTVQNPYPYHTVHVWYHLIQHRISFYMLSHAWQNCSFESKLLQPHTDIIQYCTTDTDCDTDCSLPPIHSYALCAVLHETVLYSQWSFSKTLTKLAYIQYCTVLY